MSQPAAQNPAQSNNSNGDAPPKAFGPRLPEWHAVCVADLGTLRKRLQRYGMRKRNMWATFRSDCIPLAGRTVNLHVLVGKVLYPQMRSAYFGFTPRVPYDKEEEIYQLVCTFYADMTKGEEDKDRILESLREDTCTWFIGPALVHVDPETGTRVGVVDPHRFAAFAKRG